MSFGRWRAEGHWSTVFATRSEFDVCWVMSTHCDPPEDVQFIKRAWSTPLDPMLRGAPYMNSRGIVDCCRPFGWKDEFPTVAEASPELRKKVSEKWPEIFET